MIFWGVLGSFWSILGDFETLLGQKYGFWAKNGKTHIFDPKMTQKHLKSGQITPKNVSGGS